MPVRRARPEDRVHLTAERTSGELAEAQGTQPRGRPRRPPLEQPAQGELTAPRSPPGRPRPQASPRDADCRTPTTARPGRQPARLPDQARSCHRGGRRRGLRIADPHKTPAPPDATARAQARHAGEHHAPGPPGTAGTRRTARRRPPTSRTSPAGAAAAGTPGLDEPRAKAPPDPGRRRRRPLTRAAAVPFSRSLREIPPASWASKS